MNTQHIETLIIGAGQAGLSTGYHLRRRGRPFLIVDGERAGRRQLAAAVGHAAAVHAGEVRRAARPAVPGGPLALPAEGRGRRLPRAVRAALRPSGADEHPGRPARGAAGRRVPRDARRRGRSAATTSWWPPAPSAARRTCPQFAAELDPSIRQLHSSEYRRPAQLQPGPVAGGRRVALGAGHRLRARRVRGRRSCAARAAATSRSAPSPGGPGCSSRWPCSSSGTC